MIQPTAAHSASRHHERARAAFKLRADEVKGWLNTQPGLRITGRPPGPGDVHSQQNIVLTGRWHGTDVVAKVFAETALDCLRAEAATLPRFAALGMPVPTVVHHLEGTLSDGVVCHALITAVLPGNPLSQVLPVEDLASAAAAGTAVGRLLATQYHSERHPIVAPGFAAASWARVRQRYERTLLDEFGLPAGLLAEMDGRAPCLPDPPSLGWVTFDWRLRHLLWNGTSITGLVDLEYAKPYDCAVELANLLHDLVLGLDQRRGRAFAETLTTAYLERLPAGEAPTEEVLLFYLARQALNHAAVKHWQGVTDTRPMTEARLAIGYLAASSLSKALATAAPQVPQPRHPQEDPT